MSRAPVALRLIAGGLHAPNQIGFVPQTLRRVGDDDCPYVRGPGARDPHQTMMLAQFAPDTNGEVPCLADIIGYPVPARDSVGEDIETSDIHEHRSDRVHLKIVAEAAKTDPSEE